MKKLNLLIGSLLLIFAFTVEAKSPPPGTGKADVPANIYIMLDVSGSMRAATNQSGRMYYPFDVAVDSKGNLFVVEYDYSRIKKYNSSGTYIKTIGGWGAQNGRFRYPRKIDVDADDNIYVADFLNQRVQKLDNNGNWLKNFTGISHPSGVTVDSQGNVYASYGNRYGIIRKWDKNGGYITQWGNIYYPYGLSAYGGSIYVGEYSRPGRIVKFSDVGAYQDSWSHHLNNISFDIEVNSNGVYSASPYNSTIQKYSHSGSYINRYNCRGPHGVGSDSSGNVYCVSYYDNKIIKLDSNLSYLEDIGSGGTRIEDAKKVIKKLVSSSDLTKGANFGLMTWHSYAQQRIKIDSAGANNIYKWIDNARAGGGTNLDNAMVSARNYFNGSQSPINPNASCQKNFLIVISDGHWYDSQASKIAETLYKTKGIQTFVIGFHTGGNSNYTKLAKAGGTYPDSPLYSSNWQHLYETLSAYIRQAISSRLTFTAPVVMPGISSGDHLFQSTFTYKKNHQWKGQLVKYKLKSDGGIGSALWDAGEKLDKKSDTSRQIWTAASNIGISTSLNNFTTTNLAGLKDLIWENSGKTPTDTEATNLINFVRGIDAYDENANNNNTEKRWKLGDIYHSKLAVVGIPNAKTTNDVNKADSEAYYRYQKNYTSFKNGNSCGGGCPSRKEMVYVGANDGMLHAFDSRTGDELWAFIPPTMLQSLRSMISVKANSSNSIYGVDGSPVVKDIYYDNKWRTVLLSGMGRGGHGYFALDITKPKSPLFLFAFENDPINKQIYHWDEAGHRTDLGYAVNIPAEYDYSKLGETWSTPAIVAMPYGGNRKWVAVFGAGYNGGVNTDYGSAIYVVDLEDKGKVLKRIDLTDVSSNIANSVPASVVSITPDTTSKAKYKGSMLYVADLEGKQWKLNLTNQGTLYEVTPIFDAQATVENDRMEFFQVTPTIGNDDTLWTYYGTGNQQKLQRVSSDINNRIFGLKDNKFPNYSNVNGLNNTASSSLKNTTTSGSTCPTVSDLGWYVNLGSNERVTGKLALSNEVIYATKYLPNNKQLCSPGTASLTEHEVACGNKLRTTELGEGIATGAIIHKDKIYIGISGSGSGDIKDSQGNVVGQKTENLIVLEPKKSSSSGQANVTLESWREVF